MFTVIRKDGAAWRYSVLSLQSGKVYGKCQQVLHICHLEHLRKFVSSGYRKVDWNSHFTVLYSTVFVPCYLDYSIASHYKTKIFKAVPISLCFGLYTCQYLWINYCQRFVYQMGILMLLCLLLFCLTLYDIPVYSGFCRYRYTWCLMSLSVF